MNKLRIVGAQLNFLVGDIKNNLLKIKNAILHAKNELHADLIVFSEMALAAYPPEDLLLRPEFYEQINTALNELVNFAPDIHILIGYPEQVGAIRHNAAALIYGGKITAKYYKQLLPNYGVFDEKRYFQPGNKPCVTNINGINIGITICEDLWFPGPMQQAVDAGANMVISINASPFDLYKQQVRKKTMSERCREGKVPLIYLNCVGGQDELVFDGGSFVMNSNGEITQSGEFFQEDFLNIDIEFSENKAIPKQLSALPIFSSQTGFQDLAQIDSSRLSFPLGAPAASKRSLLDINEAKREQAKHSFAPLSAKNKEFLAAFHAMQESNSMKSGEQGRNNAENQNAKSIICKAECVYNALVLGVRDYIEKNRFPGAIIGLSGGADSALTLAIAVDAIGKDRVHTVFMPSRYTRCISGQDAKQIAENFGVEYSEISIDPMFNAYIENLGREFKEEIASITEENLQARCRAIILMAISNQKKYIVLSTGNKSEMAVGYSTLYGDMVGGFCVLKDVFKTLVYELIEYRNNFAGYDIIPKRIIDRPPSAELKPDQYDTDNLPPYPILDAVLERYIEQDQSAEEIIQAGFEENIVKKVVAMVGNNEYKRRQAPVGVRITSRAFGRDRRYPITSGF